MSNILKESDKPLSSIDCFNIIAFDRLYLVRESNPNLYPSV